MKKYILMSMCIILCACGGGGGGNTHGAPGKSAYEIWLDQGNTGTEQDFLDSLVANNDASVVDSSQYASLLQEAQAKGGYVITQMPWPEHGNFYRIEKNIPNNIVNNNNTTSGNDSLFIDNKIIYNEKELNLANYGVFSSENIVRTEFGNDLYKTYIVDTWINNRDGIGANVYTPDNNTVFTGSTMAYLYEGSKYMLAGQPFTTTATNEPVFIKGSAEYTYNPTNPKLVLDFDNYYRFVLQENAQILVSGTNNTGNDRYNLAKDSGLAISNYSTITTDTNTGTIGFIKKDNIEEVVGTYDMFFDDSSYKIYAPNGEFRIVGAFGGTKQE